MSTHFNLFETQKNLPESVLNSYCQPGTRFSKSPIIYRAQRRPDPKGGFVSANGGGRGGGWEAKIFPLSLKE